MTIPHLLARVDELADARGRAHEHYIDGYGKPVSRKQSYLAGAASQRPAIEALREAVTALDRFPGLNCDTEDAWIWDRERMEALRNIARLIEGEKK